MQVEANGNAISGSCSVTPYEDWCHVLDCGFPIEGAIDNDTGQPTGHRKLGPLTIVKPMDKASPVLMQAISQNQVLKVTIKIHQPDRITKKNLLTYELVLEEAHLSHFEQTATAPMGQAAGMLSENLVFYANKWSFSEVVAGIDWADTWNESLGS